MTPDQLAQSALDLLDWLMERFGVQLVMATFGVLTGTNTALIIEDTGQFVASILTAIRSKVEDDRLRAILESEYHAADAIVDAAEKAKFG